MDFTGEDAAPAPNRTLDNTGWYDLYDAQLRQMQIPQPLPQLPFGYNNGLATYPPQPMYPQHGPAVVTERAAPVPAHPQNLEYEMPLQTPTEEPDPSTRPRLTTDQTNILESRFQQDPKPLTNTKRDLAQKIGLTLDKVNNWYQNRRAKAKNAKKHVAAYGMPPNADQPAHWPFADYQPTAYSPPPPHHPGMETALVTDAGPQPFPVPAQNMLESSAVYGDQPNYEQPNYEQPNYEQLHHSASLNHRLEQMVTLPSTGPLGGASMTDDAESAFQEMTVRYPGWDSENPSRERDLSQHEILNIIGNINQESERHNLIQSPIEGQESQAGEHQAHETAEPPSTFSQWTANHEQLIEWVSAQNKEMAELTDQMLLLQQSAIPDINMEEHLARHRALLAGEYHVVGHDNVTHSSSSLASTAPTPPSLMIQEQANQNSPIGSPFNTTPVRDLVEAISRRGSASSELASDLGTIHLQRVLSQQNSDEEVFKTPKIAHLNLAARRKRHMATLGPISVRSQSFAGPQDSKSPVFRTTGGGSSTSVRRIKSTGNSLNVIGGRIQKSGVASTQRSPHNFATFQEAGAMSHIHGFPASSPSHSLSNSTVGPVPITPYTPVANEHLPMQWNKPLMHSTSNPNMLQYQQCPPNPYESHLNSPATNPYIHMPPHPTHYQQHMPAPPQSAPAHLTSFPQTSPHYHGVPGTQASYFPPQAPEPEHYQYQPTPTYIPTHTSYAYPSRPGPYGYGQSQYVGPSPQYVGPSPQYGGQPGYYPHPHPHPHPLPPQKELEVVMAEFPKPSEANSPPKEPYPSNKFTFQNSGPADF